MADLRTNLGRPISDLVDDLDEIDSHLEDLIQWSLTASFQLETMKKITALADSINLKGVVNFLDPHLQQLSSDIVYMRGSLDSLTGKIYLDRQLISKITTQSEAKSVSHEAKPNLER